MGPWLLKDFGAILAVKAINFLWEIDRGSTFSSLCTTLGTCLPPKFLGVSVDGSVWNRNFGSQQS